ncbi:MAG: type II secretion system protein [Acidobacteriaceae bacterium]
MNFPRQHDRMPTESDFAERRVGEEGFMLLAVVVMVALLLIALSVAAPRVARQLQREKEIESQHRMEQYVRAIQLFQRRFPGQYPASIKSLEKTNNIRFLRHVYVDPLTGKADYRLIHQGEQKTKIHVFFGQELDGLAANLGSAAGLQSGGGIGGMTGGATNVTATNALNSGFGGATIGTPSGSGTSGANGTGTGTSGTNGSSSLDSLGDGNIGLIVGVGTSKTGTSITQPNGQTTYENWEFWYDPRIEMLRRNVNVTGGGVTSQAASSFGQDVSGQSNAGGSGLNATTTGSTGTNGTGSTTTPNNPNSNPF